MDEDDEGDENEPPETVTTSEIQARLREVAREQKGKEIVRRVTDEVFEEFDETPIGTGAIAQVCYLHPQQISPYETGYRCIEQPSNRI